jgi:hypothetical protein
MMRREGRGLRPFWFLFRSDYSQSSVDIARQYFFRCFPTDMTWYCHWELIWDIGPNSQCSIAYVSAKYDFLIPRRPKTEIGLQESWGPKIWSLCSLYVNPSLIVKSGERRNTTARFRCCVISDKWLLLGQITQGQEITWSNKHNKYRQYGALLSLDTVGSLH